MCHEAVNGNGGGGYDDIRCFGLEKKNIYIYSRSSVLWHANERTPYAGPRRALTGTFTGDTKSVYNKKKRFTNKNMNAGRVCVCASTLYRTAVTETSDAPLAV